MTPEQDELLKQFMQDMGDSVESVKCTDAQRERGKAWLRMAMTYAYKKAMDRK